MEEGVLNPEMLDRLQDYYCDAAAKAKRGVKIKIVLEIEFAEGLGGGEIEDTYTLTSSTKDTVRRAAGCRAQLALPGLVAAALAGPPF